VLAQCAVVSASPKRETLPHRNLSCERLSSYSSLSCELFDIAN